MKMFIPSAGTCVRLTADVVIPFRETRFANLVPARHAVHRIVQPDQPWDYRLVLDSFTLVAGTVLKFQRISIRPRAHEDTIEVSIFAHPDRRLTPKANGGTAAQVIKFELTSSQVNLLDVEIVDV